MKTRHVVLAIAFLLLTSMGFAQKVNVDWDRKTDFSSFHTYAWQKSPKPAPDCGTSALWTAWISN
jgi:hypothetical protein